MYITAQKKDWKEIHQNSDSTYFGAVGSWMILIFFYIHSENIFSNKENII